MSLVEVVPDRGKLDTHNKPQDTNEKIASIQVMVANCDECSHASELRNTFETHIQSSHVWTDHSLKFFAIYWFSTVAAAQALFPVRYQYTFPTLSISSHRILMTEDSLANPVKMVTQDGRFITCKDT